jgi:DNA-binding response OmpR family regulator
MWVVAEPARSRLTSAEEDSAMAERKRRITVVNDDTTFLELMRDLLQTEEGYDVNYCREADRAYQFVKETQPDLVILDIRVGGEESGWLILNLLTLDPATRPIPVLVCSAAIDSLQDHEALLQQYDCEVLPKPFDLAALLEKVQVALAKYRRG